MIRCAQPRRTGTTVNPLLPIVARRFASSAPPEPPAAASSSSTSSYPFSSSVCFPPSTLPPSSTPPENLLSPKNGYHVITHLNTSLRSVYDPLHLSTTLFSRRHPSRLRTGSVLTVSTYHPSRKSSSAFSGVLMGVRRRGVDTAFKLRNVVNRIGVEMTFKVCSPLLKEVRVVKRAEGKKGALRDLRKAKVNWIRDRPQIMSAIASSIKQDQLESKRI